MEIIDQDPDVRCFRCGGRFPRSEMFGVEPELTCPSCARGLRERMQVRVRTVTAVGAPVVTYGIIGIAVVLFAACAISSLGRGVPELKMLIRRNLYPGPGIWDGEVWRLLSGAFLHWSGPDLLWNLLHVGFNCWWILDLGRAMEHGFGRLALILFAVGCAMVGTGLEWMMSGGAVGLSGVVFGLALFLFVHRRTNPFAAGVMNRRTLNVLGFWFLLCIYLTATGTFGVANWAHGGGAAFGFLVGHAVLHRRRKLLVPAAALCTILFVALSTQVAFGNQARFRRSYLAAREFRHRSGSVETPAECGVGIRAIQARSGRSPPPGSRG